MLRGTVERLGAVIDAPVGALVRSARDAGIDAPIRDDQVRLLGTVALVLGASLGFFAVGPLGAGAGVLVLVVGLRPTTSILRSMAERRYEASLPLALEAVARAMRSGVSLRWAIQEAAADLDGPLAADLELIIRRVEHGQPLSESIDRWVVARDVFSTRLAGVALRAAHETGGPQARAIDGVAATLRDRLAVAAELRALSSQARVSALVLVVAPLLFSSALVLSNPAASHFLLRTPVGLGCLAAGLGLDLAGGTLMRRLTRVTV